MVLSASVTSLKEYFPDLQKNLDSLQTTQTLENKHAGFLERW